MGSWGNIQGFGLYPEETENHCGGQVLLSLPTAPFFLGNLPCSGLWFLWKFPAS